jgi:hypothetical protein
MKNRILYKSFLISILILANLIFFLSCDLIGNSSDYQQCLPPPEQVFISDIKWNSAYVSWSSVKNAKLYLVSYREKGNEYAIIYTTESTSFLFEELCFDSNYVIEIFAFSKNEEPKEFSGIPAVIEFKTPLDETPEGELSRPANLTAEIADNSSIRINFDSVEGADYYEIEILFLSNPSAEDGSFETIKFSKIIPAGQTEYLYSDGLYYDTVLIKVSARNADFSDTCRWSRIAVLDI